MIELIFIVGAAFAIDFLLWLFRPAEMRIVGPYWDAETGEIRETIHAANLDDAKAKMSHHYRDILPDGSVITSWEITRDEYDLRMWNARYSIEETV